MYGRIFLKYMIEFLIYIEEFVLIKNKNISN